MTNAREQAVKFAFAHEVNRAEQNGYRLMIIITSDHLMADSTLDLDLKASSTKATMDMRNGLMMLETRLASRTRPPLCTFSSSSILNRC